MVTVTDSSFSQEVLEASYLQPVVVDFWAEWCNPCKALKPKLEQMSLERSDIKFVSANIDDCSEKAVEYSIMSIPALLCIKDGKLTRSSIGASQDVHDQVTQLLS